MRADDLSGARRLVDAVVTARRGGERSFTGAVDLMATSYADGDLRHEFGDKVHAVPFSAAVDDQGRLVEFVIALDSLAARLEPVRVAWRELGWKSNPEPRPKSPQPLKDVVGLLRTLEGGSFLGRTADG